MDAFCKGEELVRWGSCFHVKRVGSRLVWGNIILYFMFWLVIAIFSLYRSDIVEGAIAVLGRGFSGTRALDFRDVSLLNDDPTEKLRLKVVIWCFSPEEVCLGGGPGWGRSARIACVGELLEEGFGSDSWAVVGDGSEISWGFTVHAGSSGLCRPLPTKARAKGKLNCCWGRDERGGGEIRLGVSYFIRYSNENRSVIYWANP